MDIYTSDGCKYYGMDEETILRLRAELGKPTVFITKELYDKQREEERNRPEPTPEPSLEDRVLDLEQRMAQLEKQHG